MNTVGDIRRSATIRAATKLSCSKLIDTAGRKAPPAATLMARLLGAKLLCGIDILGGWIGSLLEYLQTLALEPPSQIRQVDG